MASPTHSPGNPGRVLLSEHERDIRSLTASDTSGVGLTFHRRFASISDAFIDYCAIANHFCRAILGVSYEHIHTYISADTEISVLAGLIADYFQGPEEAPLTFDRACELTLECFGVDLRSISPCNFAGVINQIELLERDRKDSGHEARL